MQDLSTIIQRVEEAEQKKSDVAVRLTDTTPLVSGENTLLNLNGRRTYQLTPNGLTSLLSKVNIPGAFYKRSSEHLRKEMLDEHFHAQAKGQDVILRTKAWGDNLNLIRYVASSAYSKFDDIHISEALKKVNNLGEFSIKQFVQNDEFLVLRIATKEPIQVKDGRPFYPGIQILNSEIGKSSVHLAFMLWEEVCTNGMVVDRGQFDAYSKRHIGKRSIEILSEKVENYLGRLSTFKDETYTHLKRLDGLDPKQMLLKIESDKRIPKKVKEVLPTEHLKNYAPSIEEATGLDIMSAYTEAIQRYNWDSRLQYEDIAGEMLLEV